MVSNNHIKQVDSQYSLVMLREVNWVGTLDKKVYSLNCQQLSDEHGHIFVDVKGQCNYTKSTIVDSGAKAQTTEKTVVYSHASCEAVLWYSSASS